MEREQENERKRKGTGNKDIEQKLVMKLTEPKEISSI